MKIPSIVTAGMTSILVAMTILACSVGTTDDAAEQEDTIGTSREALCKSPPCNVPTPTTTVTTIKPPKNPPPPGPEPFTCKGSGPKLDDGRPTTYESVNAAGGECYNATISTDCTCALEAPSWECWENGDHCWGLTIVSIHTCPLYAPYQRCDGYGSCTCSAF